MLPAISAELPVYLVPPRTSGDGQPTAASLGFGPSAHLDLAAAVAGSVQRTRPRGGLYGPDGRFVEAGVRRETPPQDGGDNPTSDAQATGDAQTNAAATFAESTADANAGERQLSIHEVDAVIPPAARTELKDLADRVKKDANTRILDANDYKQIAHLMNLLGRFDDAKQAMEKAARLEGSEPKNSESQPAAA